MKTTIIKNLRLLLIGLLLSTINHQQSTTVAATVTGTLSDISLDPLSTTMLFTPTNDVLVTSTGLSAGPPKAIDTIAGNFSLVLDAGDYSVSLPLIPSRHPFKISVPVSSASINITNLLSAPASYTYTNNLSYTLKTTPWDSTADFLNTKLLTSGSLVKSLSTNSGAVVITLANYPLQTITNNLIAWSTNPPTSLAHFTNTIPANSLRSGSVLIVDAFGNFSDPILTAPDAHFSLYFGSAVLVSKSFTVGNFNWHAHGLITIRSTGASAAAIGSLSVTTDNPNQPPFSMAAATAIVDTTAPLAFTLLGSIDDYTQAEALTCAQAIFEIR